MKCLISLSPCLSPICMFRSASPSSLLLLSACVWCFSPPALDGAHLYSAQDLQCWVRRRVVSNEGMKSELMIKVSKRPLYSILTRVAQQCYGLNTAPQKLQAEAQSTVCGLSEAGPSGSHCVWRVEPQAWIHPLLRRRQGIQKASPHPTPGWPPRTSSLQNWRKSAPAAGATPWVVLLRQEPERVCL